MGFPGGSGGKESTCNAGDLSSVSGLGRSPGGRHGNPLRFSCLENPHEQRSLAGYIPWGCKESDTTERLSTTIQPHPSRRCGFDPWIRKVPWRRTWQPIPVFWPGVFHGLYSQWGHKELDTTERLSLHFTTSLGKRIYSPLPQRKTKQKTKKTVL